MDIEVSEYPGDVEAQASALGCLAPSGVAVLPLNFLQAGSKGEFVDEEFAPAVRRAWREAAVEETALVDTGDQFRTRVCESATQWAHLTIFVGGLLLTQNPAAVQLAIGVLGDTLADAFKRRGVEGGVTLDVVLREAKSGRYLQVRYKGGLEGLKGLSALLRQVRAVVPPGKNGPAALAGNLTVKKAEKEGGQEKLDAEILKERIKAIGRERLQGFSSEQLAGLVLTILRGFATDRLRTATGNRNSLSAILGFWLVPLWEGRDALDGYSTEGGVCQSIPAMKASTELARRFEEAVLQLHRHRLVRPMPDQDSDDLVEVTEEGLDMIIFRNFEMDVEREADEIISQYRESIFHIVAWRGHEHQDGGTAFLVQGYHIVTCAHCLDTGRFDLHLGDAPLNQDFFDTAVHAQRDVAVLTLKSHELGTSLRSRRPIRLERVVNGMAGGGLTVTFGFPHLPGMLPGLVPEPGRFKAYTAARDGCDYLTFTNSSEGGNSGGPVLNSRGRLVGIMSDVITSERTDGHERPRLSVCGYATPAKYAAELLPDLSDTDRPLPYKRCPKCEGLRLGWGYDYEVDLDREGHASSTRVPEVYCQDCGWATREFD